MIEKTLWHSWKNGNIAKGCKLCVCGEKTVLFITGLCSKNTRCYYCPIADNRSGKDVIYANETLIENVDGLCREIRLCGSEGIGITGGDPLMKIERVVEYIKAVKSEFGKDFHVHLYCPMELVSEEKLKLLNDAGLDEIRFHLDVDDKKMWNKLMLAKKFMWKVGVEIPAVPGKEYNKMLEFLKGNVDFLNLNELELSDSEVCKLGEEGFKAKNDYSYAVIGSEELALKLLGNCDGMNVHYCTVKLKDDVQIPMRLKNRLRNVKHDFDEVNDYNLIRGAIYTKDLKPGFGYRKVLGDVKNKDEVLDNLKKLKNDICKELSIKKDFVCVDEIKLRLLTSRKIVGKFKEKIKGMGLVPAVVEELPSGDEFELEIEFL